MMTILPLLLLTLLSGPALSCDCDDCCWQKCFSDPGMYSAEYARLHSMITTLIAQKQTLGTGGTAFLFDYTTNDPSICLYQKNLASLIALTMPVSDVCNPFFFNKNAYNFAWYAWSWQCKNKCQAASTISNSGDCITAPPYPPYPTENYINGGCILAAHAFNNPGLPCSKNTVFKREMVVALANSPFTPSGWSWCINPPFYPTPYPTPGFTRAAIGVENVDIAQTDAFASNPLLSFDFTSLDGPMAQAAIQQLLKCINHNCCDGSVNTPVKREAKIGNITILAPGSDTPFTLPEEEAELLIQEIIDNTHVTTTTTKPPTSCAKPTKKCARMKGKCYKTPPSKSCKAKGWCDKRKKCKCYICKE